MLPGFRFLFAAIVLSTSILVFGVGAAALLRAAHEEFASSSSLRVAPEPKFAQQNEAPKDEPREPETPVLAMLRIEPEPAPQQAVEGIPAAAAPAEPPAIVAAPDEPAPTPGPAEEVAIAAAEQLLPPANETAASEPATAASASDGGIAAMKIATLGGPPVVIEAPPLANAAGARPDPEAARKRLQARRAKERRRIALRARQAAAQQQAADPFTQPAVTTRSR